MKLIVGLGNPGEEYKFTRHNLGFIVLDTFAKKIRDTVSDGLNFKVVKKIVSAIAKTDRIILAKPQTFVNLSGEAVKKIFDFYKIVQLSDLLVVYDDFSLPLGKIRMRLEGSSGGHKGIVSIINSLGTDQFARLKLGIGYVPAGFDPKDFVLSEFTTEEKPVVRNMVDESILFISQCINGIHFRGIHCRI